MLLATDVDRLAIAIRFPRMSNKGADLALHLPETDFRRERVGLADEAFALGHAAPLIPPSDLIDQAAWSHITGLADDVALSTSSHQGSQMNRMYSMYVQWLDATYLEARVGPFLFEASMLATEELDAVMFNALHGYYRQGLGCLRNIFEVLTHATGFAVTASQAGLHDWLAGIVEPKVGLSLGTLHNSQAGQILRDTGSGYSVFGANATDYAWARDLYRRLCAPSHSRAGSNNADIWESNGPVYRPDGLDLVVSELEEVFVFAGLLARIAHPAFPLPPDASKLFGSPAQNWAPAARLLIASRLLT
jgi:hypothetical protein